MTGVVVVDVARDSVAAERGMRPGDVIASLSLDPVQSVEQATQRLDELRKSGESVVTVLTKRQGADSFIALPIG